MKVSSVLLLVALCVTCTSATSRRSSAEAGGARGWGEGTKRTFDFGPGEVARGAKRVLSSDLYSPQRGDGFHLGSTLHGVIAEARGGDPLLQDFVTSAGPFVFAADVPSEGNWRVSVTLRAPQASDSVVTIRAESRRLMVEQLRVPAGESVLARFLVNVRTPALPDGKQVKLKEREIGGLHWDQKLTLEFTGERPGVAAVELEKVEDAVTLFLVGDSTVTDQAEEPWCAWGQMLPRFFDDRVAVANHAESGESLKSFVAARRWEKVLSQLKLGDYIFIQFGHNDQKDKSPDAGAFNSYQRLLEKFVDETRERGGYPVLVTPVQRRRMGPDGKNTDTLGDFPVAVRRVAAGKQ